VRLTRVYAGQPLAPGAVAELPATTAHHLVRVLRLRAGAPLVLFDGSGTDYAAEIVEVAGGSVRARVGTARPGLDESPLAITLVQGVSRGERMDWTLQKAVELGARCILPVLTTRSVVRLDERQSAQRLRHWQAVVAAACEQCGRSVLPALEAAIPLGRHLASAPRADLRLVLDPAGADSLAKTVAAAGMSHVELLVGPEGGLDETELVAAARAGYRPVRLGPRVLRTETAGVAALAVLQALAGDLR
jgi:16S rRNA (uracil1498-N3)-methyltransferase